MLPGDLPQVLPLFPLSGALLLPHAQLPLRIFEPRYVAMLEDVLKSPARLIGMIQPLSTPGNSPDGALHRIGCAGRVVSFNEAENGSYRVTLRGVSRFRLHAQVAGATPYLRGDVDWSGFTGDIDEALPDDSFDRESFLAMLERYLSINSLSSDMDTLRDAEEELLVNSLAILNPFEAEDKQALLEAPTLAKRRETLMMLMEFALNDKNGKGRLQ